MRSNISYLPPAPTQAKKVRFDTVDGLDPANAELRGKLFDVSGQRGVYPQASNHILTTRIALCPSYPSQPRQAREPLATHSLAPFLAWQVFILKADGEYAFVGDYEGFESLVECETLPK